MASHIHVTLLRILVSTVHENGTRPHLLWNALCNCCKDFEILLKVLSGSKILQELPLSEDMLITLLKVPKVSPCVFDPLPRTTFRPSTLRTLSKSLEELLTWTS